MLAEWMAAEVACLCGVKYRPNEEWGFQRAGSASGKVLFEGKRQEVQRPRVRRRKADGATEEIRLRTYEAAQQPDELHEMVIRALVAGVSGREMKEGHPLSFPAAAGWKARENFGRSPWPHSPPGHP